MKRKSLIVSALGSLFSLLGSSSIRAETFLDWNPLPPELPPMEYDAIFFDPDDPASWNWSQSFSNEIKDLFVAAPIHSIPYEPIVEYDGSHNDFEASLSFSSPGVYAAKIDFLDDSLEDTIQFFYAGASVSNNKCDTCKPLTHSRPVEIEHPGADLIIIDTQRDGDNKFVEVAAEILDGEQEAGNVQGAINLVNQAFTNNGNKPVSVKIVGHGAGNIISIGGGQNPGAGQFLQNSNADVQNFVNQLKGKISALTLKGCCIAQGVNEPGRNHLMEVLADGLGVPVTSWNETITAVRPRTLLGITLREGYFGIDVHGEKGSIQPVPEHSSTVSLLAIGIGGIGLTLKRKLKSSKSPENKIEKIS